jgi:hypothetical protein
VANDKASTTTKTNSQRTSLGPQLDLDRACFCSPQPAPERPRRDNGLGAWAEDSLRACFHPAIFSHHAFYADITGEDTAKKPAFLQARPQSTDERADEGLQCSLGNHSSACAWTKTHLIDMLFRTVICPIRRGNINGARAQDYLTRVIDCLFPLCKRSLVDEGNSYIYMCVQQTTQSGLSVGLGVRQQPETTINAERQVLQVRATIKQ